MELLGREIWGMEDIEVIPSDLTKAVARNGGVAIGAFAPHLVGFVFGFLGQQNGEIKHHSHIAGVAREVQNQDIGYRLKLAQREAVMRDGIDLITWTFDPLESRNARFNFRKLGVTCKTYIRNAYGEMRDQLNAGLPSDRFQVDWRLKSDRVTAAITRKSPEQSASMLISNGVPLVDSADSITASKPVLIEIPANFQKVKAASREEALSWRMRTRDLFEKAFSSGLMATDLLIENGRSYYLLESG
jgi:predicted GNAT superfamily acetyltransferase